MKIQIPDQLKADMPQTMWGRILSATPVVMAVIATMLAGLASSEMTLAQYDRSLAAQQQSKAGDQWNFFQAKRLRGAFQQSSLDIVQGTAEVHPFDMAALKRAAEQMPAEAAAAKTELLALLDSTAGQQGLAALQQARLPELPPALVLEPKLKAALEAVESMRPEAELAPLIAQLDDKILEAALRAAKDRALVFDVAVKPASQTTDLLEKLFARQTASTGTVAANTASFRRDFTVARLRFTALRYETEARLNQAIANFYELQVRRSNISSERHHARSQRFFFGMLGAQLGVIIATFAIAARKRNLLWSLAAGAGVAAVGFAVYVYLYV